MSVLTSSCLGEEGKQRTSFFKKKTHKGKRDMQAVKFHDTVPKSLKLALHKAVLTFSKPITSIFPMPQAISYKSMGA